VWRSVVREFNEELEMSDSIAAANKALVRRFYKEVYGDWNMTLVNEVVSPRFTSHDWPEGTPTGRQGFELFYSAIRTALPDARYEVDDLIAEGDKVVVRWRLFGTHLGDFRGIAPSAQKIALDGIAIYRVEGGKLMERWVVTDLYGLLEEMRESAGRA
jgi:predicted ester cyclase